LNECAEDGASTRNRTELSGVQARGRPCGRGVVQARGIEPRSPALQAGATTTLAQPAKMEPTAGVDPAPAPYEGAVLPITLRRLVQAQRFELRSHAYRARVLPLDEAWVVGREGIEPSVAGLKDRSFTVVASVPSYALGDYRETRLQPRRDRAGLHATRSGRGPRDTAPTVWPILLRVTSTAASPAPLVGSEGRGRTGISSVNSRACYLCHYL
jgi:hypothetical protein